MVPVKSYMCILLIVLCRRVLADNLPYQFNEHSLQDSGYHIEGSAAPRVLLVEEEQKTTDPKFAQPYHTVIGAYAPVTYVSEKKRLSWIRRFR